MNQKKAKLTAFCGMMVALSVVLMSITTIIPVFMYIIPLLTGLVVLLCEKLSSKKWAIAVYFAVSALSLILVADKEAVLAYCLFFGYYPIIRDYLQKLPKLLFLVTKLGVFNLAAVLIGVLGVYLFGLSAEEYSEFGKATIPILLALANLMFFMYELLLGKYGFMIERIAKKIKKQV